MGAWGTGPFDSDSALDYLSDLAHTHARIDDDGNVVPDSVNEAEVAATLTDTLTAVTRAETDDEYRRGTCDNAYAAAGLVAAALTRAGTATTGTRLLAALDDHRNGVDPLSTDPAPLGLNAHCGRTDLLTPETAATLREAALAATDALTTETGWIAGWHEPGRVLAQLTRLRIVLAATGIPAPLS